ncbi:hypothetical protein B0H13DRAFT_2568455, partial [Mycena leptocephala]
MTLLALTEYDISDEEVCTKIHKGEPDFLVTAGSWWLGLYLHNKCDPNEPDKGLFRSHLLIMIWKYIFTSPVSVKTMPLANPQNLLPTPYGRTEKKEKAKAAATPKCSVAAIIGLNRVTGRSIAYVAVQV